MGPYCPFVGISEVVTVSRKLPCVRIHRASGQWTVTCGGRVTYLGKARGAAEARAARLLAWWTAAGRPSRRGGGLTVEQLVEKFKESEFSRFGVGEGRYYLHAFRRLIELTGAMPATELTPAVLHDLVSRMAGEGASKSYIRGCLRRVRSAWRWATAAGLVSAETMGRLSAMRPVQEGGPGRPRPTPTMEQLEAVLEALPEAWRVPIEVQLRGGMRVNELLQMRPRDIEVDRKRGLWLYRPPTHKTAHRGAERVVPLGPRAQSLLRPILPRDESVLVFRFAPRALNRALARGCAAAGVERFSSHGLRRAWATTLRKKYGLDVARAGLGHSSATVTASFYAERDVDATRKAALEIG